LPFVVALLFFGCSTPSGSRKGEVEKPAGDIVVESIQTAASKNQSTITITSSKPTTHNPSFTLKTPPRICLDVKGVPAHDLPKKIDVGGGLITRIIIQNPKPGITRLVVELSKKGLSYGVATKGPNIVLRVTPPAKEAAVPKKLPDVEALLPSTTHLLGIDITPFEGGRSRMTIITDKEAPYKVEMQGAKKLTVKLDKTSVTPQLLNQLASMPSKGAVDGIRALYSTKDHRVTLGITLNRMIPYHVTQEGRNIRIDFSAAPQKPVQVVRKPAPVEVRLAAPAQPSEKGGTRAEAYETVSKDYAGEKMSFDFVDTDIRNILQLIADVADINIVWGSDVEGKVSMRLDNVPWDQALEMVLRPNGLTYQIEDDVLWVVPKATLVDMEMKERNRKSALLAQKRVQGIFEPKILEYLIIRHRKAEDIYKMLVGDPGATPPIPGVLDIEADETKDKEKGEEEEGKSTKIVAKDMYLTYDSGTNMIIANGVRSKVEKVKELITKMDVPEKQVLIEARVVEAETGFIRDLGVQWNQLHGDGPGFERKWYDAGSNSWGGGEFSTNPPGGWSPTIGIALGWLTNGGLGVVSLDASLALGESENKAHIISAPKAMTINGGKAVISRGKVEYFPIKTLDTIDMKEVSALLSLTVSPTVSADNSHITMLVEVKDARPTPGIVKNDLYEVPPGRREKSITTNLMVRTGDTIVIGGIYQEIRDTAEAGVPWLKDVPLLGWLFKAERKQVVTVELIIFLTPTVVTTTKDQMAQKGGV